MKLEINQKLQDDIFNAIPQNYNKLEKALFIYNQLCLKLTYSVKGYIDIDNCRDYFIEPKNLKYVDGEKNTDVVCYTFNYIFLQLLINANICSERVWENNNPFDIDNTNLFKHAHRKLELMIDGVPYKVDSTLGVLDNNDLALAKYSTQTFIGWSTVKEHTNDKEPSKEDNISKLNNAIKKVRSDCLKLKENANRYYEIKKSEGNFYSIPLKERVDMFLNEVKNLPEYQLFSFNYLLKLKHKFFTGMELNEDMAKNIDLLFVKNQKLTELQALLFVNYDNKIDYRDKNKVLIYHISVKDKNYSLVSSKELSKLILTEQITSRHNEKISKYTISMMNLEEEKE